MVPSLAPMAVPVPIILDPLLAPDAADEVVRMWHEFSEYGQYSNEGFATQFAPELPQRYDARENFVRSGGRFARQEDKGLLGARTNYFRETYAYVAPDAGRAGTDVFVDGVESLMHNDVLLDAARQLHARPVIVPAIVYANILLPGQELAVHTDVPEFRGANRKVVPQWLLVVARHSGLFEPWRMPIATAVMYFGKANGGALAYYPEGPDGAPAVFEPRHNTAAMLDTDTIFHGVDRVEGDDSALHDLRSGMRLRHDGDGTWTVRDGERVVATYGTDDLRYSLSWKGYCFADGVERDAWEQHTDDLTLDLILARLIDDLGIERPASDADLGRLLIETYITFPAPA